MGRRREKLKIKGRKKTGDTVCWGAAMDPSRNEKGILAWKGDER